MKYKKFCPSCGKELDYSCKKALNLSLRRNASCIACSSAIRNNNSRKFNMRFLLENTKHSFYWIGLLLSDGYIGNDTISLCLHKKDRILIEEFRLLCNNPNINIKGDSLRISIRDKVQVNDFINKFKILPKKHTIQLTFLHCLNILMNYYYLY